MAKKKVVVVAPELVSVAKTVEITAHSKVTVKVSDTFYSLDYSETRSLPEVSEEQLEFERNKLWTTVNGEVDNQIRALYKAK